MGAYHLTEKSGWGIESIMVSDLPVYRRIVVSRAGYGLNQKGGAGTRGANESGTEKLVNGK